MSYDSLLAGEQLFRRFLQTIRENHLAGCYILCGPDGSGRLDLVRRVMASLCCDYPNADGSFCGSCHYCLNILSGRYVDLIEISPEKDKAGISVDQIRRMQEFLAMQPSEKDWRFIVLFPAEKMRQEAQNALLKSIEEVPKNTVFFLITSDPSRLLPTVRSRAVLFQIDLPPENTICSVLCEEGVEEVTARFAAGLSQGSLNAARDYAHSEELLENHNLVLSYFRAVLLGASFTKLSALLPPSNQSRAALYPVMRLFKLALRDILQAGHSAVSDAIVLTDPKLLNELVQVVKPEAVSALFSEAEKVLQALEANQNVYALLTLFHLKAVALSGTQFV